MTASQQPAKGVESGRKRLLTYGKASRKRVQHTTSTSPGETTPHVYEPVGDTQFNPAKIQPRSLPISQQSKSASSRPVALKTAQDASILLKDAPHTYEANNEAWNSKRNLSNLDPASSNSEGIASEATPSPPPKSKSPLMSGPDISSNSSFAHRQKRSSEIVDRANSSSVVNSTGARDRSQHLPEEHNRKRPFSATKPRRPRLIDTLSAQRVASPEPDSKPNDGVSELSQSDHSFTPGSQRLVSDRDARLRQDHRSRDTPKRRKIKYTYSQSRSFLGDSQSSRGMDTGESDPLLLESLLAETSKPPSPGAFDFPDDDDDDNDMASKTAIRSVHELRRAGAHNRFADEMEDLLFRIGSPNCDGLTMRRNALLELASKLDGAEFTNQFRNHAARDSIAKGIGNEGDIICAIALSATLVIFLASGPAPHLLHQLAEDNVGKFLGQMLRVQDDIDIIASQRAVNLSKSSRTTVRHVKMLLLKMPIWHGYNISSLSPRDLGLQLLEKFFRVSEPRHLEMVAGELESDLALLAEQYSLSSAEADVGIPLIVSIFEAQSSATTSSSERPTKFLRLVPLIAKLLPSALQRWSEAWGDLESNTLKLAINLTNTEGGATAFDNPAVLADLANCINKGVLALQDTTGDYRMPKEKYDGLLLLLGVMINIMEHCAHARITMNEASIESLANLYMTSRVSMTEAETAKKSELTVPFGYLSVLLGYLSLAGSTRAQISARIKSEGARGLVETIQQLITMYNNSGNDAGELESLVNELRIRYRS